MTVASDFVWVFNCAPSMFRQHNLSGVLTEYPLGVGAYDWSITEGMFQPKKIHEFSPRFIAGFSAASQRHVHYIKGLPRSEDTLDVLIDDSADWT
ncbi:hypothetical protein ACNOYE_30085 [Nannocystaceae bacterium ST9]